MPDATPPTPLLPTDDPTWSAAVAPLLSTYEMFLRVMAVPRPNGPTAQAPDTGRP
ncbi:hypothetical protein [Streptomyces griseorubiginosus]|uniref:hypothetical protein n=1 Tax=Streptomyces griseorubiginosus TaxID=67304 RepID=UPI0036F16400